MHLRASFYIPVMNDGALRLVLVNFDAVGIGLDLPVYPGNAHAGVVAGISFVKNFDGVVPQRRILGGRLVASAQAGFKVA